MKFVTSDTHFYHDSLLGMNDFAPRPFKNIEQMNATIIKNWNDKVGENDIVYHLGDIALYFVKPQKQAYQAVFEVLDQLHGHLVLIKGNHDSRAFFKYLEGKNYQFGGRPKFAFHDVGALLKYDHRQYYLTHYPMMLGIAPQIINLHGHIHHYAVPIKENINVGVDSPELDYLATPPAFGAPLNFAEVEEMVTKKAREFEAKNNGHS